MVASATDIKYSDLESLCKKIKEWATKEYNSKMSTLLRGRNKKKDVED
jgi:translation initiation factor IF-3